MELWEGTLTLAVTIFYRALLIFSYRILELKNEMLNLELLEFHYFDDILTDMKLTPVSCTLRGKSSSSMNTINDPFAN